MRSTKFWLRVLNVYPGEWKVVKRLYLFQFFQGAGIAFFFTSSFAQFLERFPITELPLVMIFSALLLWGAGFAYTKLEHKINFDKFNWLVIIFMAASILVLWVVNYWLNHDWFLYLMLAWFNVLYLLNNLQFWGTAAILFDLRQSKRLFAVISAGDIPAKFIGYSLALIFVPYTGTQNLLVLGAGCMIASLPFFNSILKSGHPEIHWHVNRHHHNHKVKHAPKISALVKNITTNSYIRRIAFISLLTSTCIILINYGFYGEVRKAYDDDVALARFIALFYASLRVVAFVTKMVFTSRLTASLGIRQALFITPVGMVLLIGIIVSVSSLTPDQKLIFYLFGVSSMVVDVLRTSFNSPVLLTLMQPLPTHERLRAHNIVKGVMDPFASLLSGIFLLSLFYVHNRVDLMFLCYVLLGLGALWVAGVILVNRQYMDILIRTIGSRFFSREEFELRDEAVIRQLEKKMMKGTDLEVISILRMLSSKIDPTAEDLIIRLLQHSSNQVKLEALKLIGNRHLVDAKNNLELLLAEEQDEEVKAQAVTTLCKLAGPTWDFEQWLGEPEQFLRTAAVTGMLVNRDENIKDRAELVLSGLIHSPEREDKMAAISILTGIREAYDHPSHAVLIDDADAVIRNLSIKAVGRACHSNTLDCLFRHLSSQEKAVLIALHDAGVKALPGIRDQLLGNTIAVPLRQKLILLCGKIAGSQAVEILLELLGKKPQDAAAVIKALHRSKYIANEQTQKQLESIAKKYIVYGVELLHMQEMLSSKDSRYDLLNSSLEMEIQEIREVLLCLFGCMYDRQKINQVKYGLNANHKETVANAMEIIELTVKKDIGRQFNLMFETATLEHRCKALRNLFTEKHFGVIEHILVRILSEKPVDYYNWTKACSLYISKKYYHPLDSKVYKKFTESENELLKETALFASATS